MLEAELFAALYGLRIAWSTGFGRLEVETDSADAVDLLLNGVSEDGKLQAIIQDINEVGDDSLTVAWKKIDRLANNTADILAKFSNFCNGSCVIFDHMPDFLVFSLNQDCCGLPDLLTTS